MRVSSPKRELRHRQLLTAALRVFSRDGFDAASVASIAEEAGVAKGSVYLYFESKDALASDLVRDVFTQEDGATIPSTAVEPLHKIIEFCDEQERRILSLGEFAPIVLHMWGAIGRQENNAIGRGMRQVVNESTFLLETLIESAREKGLLPRSIETESSARCILALCYGIIQHKLSFERGRSFQMTTCGEAVRIFLRGLGASL
jgi:TetR/AcrR family fatty acid metabolism transcriptional regulator